MFSNNEFINECRMLIHRIKSQFLAPIICDQKHIYLLHKFFSFYSQPNNVKNFDGIKCIAYGLIVIIPIIRIYGFESYCEIFNRLLRDVLCSYLYYFTITLQNSLNFRGRGGVFIIAFKKHHEK